MGKILQKKKRMSSLPKATLKLKSKKRHLSNPVVAAAWNKKETLSQNYRRLGLAVKLNKSAGGVERIVTGSRTPAGLKEHLSSKPSDALIIEKGRPAGAVGNITEKALRETLVERDPETGKIIRIIEQGGEDDNPLNDPLNELDDSDPEMLDVFLHVPVSKTGDTDVVRALEDKAGNGRRKEPRKQSDREQNWIERLVEKHGDNYQAMFRDVKLNPMQQSVGDIRKRVEKFRKTQGLD